MSTASATAFAHVISKDDAAIDLAVGALLVAEVDHPVEVAGVLDEIDRLAEGARAAVRPNEDPLVALLRHLFDEVGFRGNDDDYYDPQNSFLDVVLERRLGIPITLSIVLLEVGRRMGLDLRGIGFPGHFLVLARTPRGDVVLDPFHGGTILSREDLTARLEQALGREVELSAELMPMVTKRQILTRVLNNLRGIYERSGDGAREAAVVELLTVLNPDDPRLQEARRPRHPN